MTLQFPTIAERAIADWQSQSVTIPFEKIAKHYGGSKSYDGCNIEWHFDDDTTARITGRGSNYRLEALLP